VLSLALGLALGCAPSAVPTAFVVSVRLQEPETKAPELFVKARRVIVRPGEELADAALLIRGGRIVAVGKDLAAPDGARTLEGEVACAGFVDAWSAFGIDPEAVNDERANAATRTIDSLDPYLDDRLLKQLAESGVTGYRLQAGGNARFGGIGTFVRLHPGVSGDENVVLEDCCVAASVGITRGERGQDVFDRVAELDRLLGALGDAQNYMQDKIEYRHDLEKWEKDIAAKQKELEEGFKKAQKDREKEEADAKEKGKEFKEKKYKEDRRPRAPRFDSEKESLARCMNGELPLIVEAHGAAELRGLLDGTKEFDRLRLVIAGGTEALSVASELAERHIPVIVWPAPQGKLQDSGALTRLELRSGDPALAGALEERGVEVLLGSGGAVPSGTRDLPYLAALAVGYGLEREAALAALTTRPARVLDVADRIGSLEAGKQADVLVLSGDPLSTTARVQFVVAGGDIVYDGKE
jgi:imidazolonepropionase-like amidohydrolase